jgi:hypothetical protein
MKIKEPTSEQCSNKEQVFEDETKVGYAIWYPQMGGYIGKAVALFDKQWKSYPHGSSEGGCIDVFVWHNGEFPFSESECEPREIHHCDPEQFVEFGKSLTEINERGRIKA